MARSRDPGFAVGGGRRAACASRAPSRTTLRRSRLKTSQELKGHGFSDGEVFDIAVTAAGRAFFTKVIESLGVATGAPLRSLDPRCAKR